MSSTQTGFFDSLVAEIRENPLAAALIGGGAFWLVTRGGGNVYRAPLSQLIWAVRGLLCHGCNLRLGRVEHGHLRDAGQFSAYLDNAWYRTDGLPLYLERALRWTDPSERAAREATTAAMFPGRVPDRYLRVQEAREVWCREFLEGQPLYMSAARI